VGFYIDEKRFEVKVSYTRPEYVCFAFCGWTKHDPLSFNNLGRGSIGKWGPYWELNLASEESHFFSRTADEQLALLKGFLMKAFGDAKACLAAQQSEVMATPERLGEVTEPEAS
jgi:hypothetical protein